MKPSGQSATKSSSKASAVSADGTVVVGNATDAGGQSDAVSWTSGTITVLGTFTATQWTLMARSSLEQALELFAGGLPPARSRSLATIPVNAFALLDLRGALTFTGTSSYTGGATLYSGTLDLAALGAAGAGPITFETGRQILPIENAALSVYASRLERSIAATPEIWRGWRYMDVSDRRLEAAQI
jgi:probable HAF family extracellular repeat protein/autotransporter-associated beta strand protein